MARNFLGNLKGPKGDKGEPGGFNGEIIGVNNMLDISNAYGNGGYGQVNFDPNTGVINYTTISTRFNIPFYLPDNTETLTFSVKDYDIEANNGEFRFRLQDSDGSALTSYINADKNVPVLIDVSGLSGDLTLTVHSGSSGTVDKPMLVEGEYTSNFQLSEKDRINFNSLNKDSMRGRLTPDSFVVGANTPLNVVELNSDGIESTDDHILLTTPGTYLFTSNPSLSFGDSEGTLHISVFVNGERVARFRNTGNMTVQVTHLFKATNGDTLSFEYYYEGESTGSTRFHFDDRNEFKIVRL